MSPRLLWRSKSSAAQFQARQMRLNFQADSSVERRALHGNSISAFLLLFALLNLSLDSGIRNQPEQRGEHVQPTGDPWTDKLEREGGESEAGGAHPFCITATRLG